MIRKFVAVLALLFFSLFAQALTIPQLQALKAAINANPTWAASPNNDDGHYALSALLNQPASPTYYVARSSLSRHEILTGVSDDGTTFDWASAGGYIARSQGERDAFLQMFNSTGAVNPSQTNIKLAFADIFSGNGVGAVTNRSHITAMSRRPANSCEKVLATGAGTKASPSVMGYEGTCSPSDVQQARSL